MPHVVAAGLLVDGLGTQAGVQGCLGLASVG